MAVFVMECPTCRHLLEAVDEQINGTAVCPYCKQSLIVRRPPCVQPFREDGKFPVREQPEGNIAPGLWSVR